MYFASVRGVKQHNSMKPIMGSENLPILADPSRFFVGNLEIKTESDIDKLKMM
jgi:hypothetical protein